MFAFLFLFMPATLLATPVEMGPFETENGLRVFVIVEAVGQGLARPTFRVEGLGSSRIEGALEHSFEGGDSDDAEQFEVVFSFEGENRLGRILGERGALAVQSNGKPTKQRLRLFVNQRPVVFKQPNSLRRRPGLLYFSLSHFVQTNTQCGTLVTTTPSPRQ